MENNEVYVTKKNNSGGSMWRWIGIYLIIAALAYGVVYYMNNKKSPNGTMNALPSPTQSESNTVGQITITPGSAMATTASPETSPTTPTASSNNIFMSKTDPVKGGYMTDTNGMTLYAYDRDSTGVSNCTGTCSQAWPPYPATSAPSTLPTDISVIRRSDGTTQYAWKGLPLYYYVQDAKAGDMKGDGTGGVWHIIKL